MKTPSEESLQEKLKDEDYEKLYRIKNPKLIGYIAWVIQHCEPSMVKVCDDSEDDIAYTREAAIKHYEEARLATPGHTVHFDGFHDQARDKNNTRFLLPKGETLGPGFNTIDRVQGLKEVNQLLKGIMRDHELFVKFYTLGPTGSVFSILCVQLTDSAYVAHTEDILYRPGYQEFLREGPYARFFTFLHSQGELEPAGLGLMVSKNITQRRVYIDLETETIYSLNTQYGGNSIGLKKLAMRLAINRAYKEHWLTEHMLIMGVHGPNGRVSYFTGAFPSMCGKTSTAMIKGETIVGDDIAFIRVIDGTVRAVNVEKGIFGIIEGINDVDDPIQWKTLNSPGEIIFSNVLVTRDGYVYWNGKPGVTPADGVNHSNIWFQGKTDDKGELIPPSHKNARFTFDMTLLDNVDPCFNNPEGVEVKGFIYGGRDSDTSVPVEESFNWDHGVITKGACLESETTAATLGKEGVRVFNPMSNIDFLSIPIGWYIQAHLDFGHNLRSPPRVFSVNYFLKDANNQWLNHKNDKAVWLKWMELRVHDEVDVIKTPTGLIPLYHDLKKLFKEVLHRDYEKDAYQTQFTVRTPENLAKIERMKIIFTTRVKDTPLLVFKVLEEQKQRLLAAQKEHGDYIKPEDLI